MLLTLLDYEEVDDLLCLILYLRSSHIYTYFVFFFLSTHTVVLSAHFLVSIKNTYIHNYNNHNVDVNDNGSEIENKNNHNNDVTNNINNCHESGLFGIKIVY